MVQGITLRLSDDGRCLVARIIHGGMIHRQGLSAKRVLLVWLTCISDSICASLNPLGCF